MSDDRVSWFDSQAVKTEDIHGPFLRFIFFLTVSYKNKEEYCSLYLLTSPVLVIYNSFEIGDLVNALRMETNH